MSAPTLTDCPTWPPEFASRYRARRHWTGERLGDLLLPHVAERPDDVALVAGADRVSYRELDARVDRLVGGLTGLGIASGDRVVVQLPNVAAFVEVVFALWRLGALPVFALPSHRRSELVAFSEQTAAVALVTCDRHARFDHAAQAVEVKQSCPTLRHLIVAGASAVPGCVALDALRTATPSAVDGPDPGDVAFLQLSGGSTGRPKLIPRTHDDYLYSVRESAGICGLGALSVYLAVLPAAHNFTLSSPGVLGALFAGGRVVLAASAAPEEAFALIARERVTITAVVPPLALAWMDAAPVTEQDLTSLEVLQVGGAKLADEAARRVRPALGCTVQQVFGMAEGLVCYTRLNDPEDRRVTTQGRPISPDDELRVVDEDDREVADGVAGHLLTRGPYTIRGYYRAPEHDARVFTPDGFYRTGDVVRLTPTGDVVVVGRAKDQINRGGEKVAAEEVEDHLLAHPAVREAAVVAMPDPHLGERSCAFVVPDGEAPEATELRRFVRDRGVAAFKVPDRIEIVAELPRTGVGKVSKRELRERIAARLASRTATHPSR